MMDRRKMFGLIVPALVATGAIARKAWAQMIITPGFTGHYGKNKTTQAFLAELSTDIGITISELVQSVKGGGPAEQRPGLSRTLFTRHSN